MTGCKALAGALLLLALPLAAHAEDWSRVRDDANDPAYAESKAICARVIDARPPEADLPTPAEAAALKGCDSEALYYGGKQPADAKRARLCAFAESGGGEGASDAVFSGQTILMMLYANGRGVKPDLDLAIHYACNIDGAPMESDGRVKHLAELKARGPGKDPFDFCDDITSGLAMGYCAARDQTRGDVVRQARLDELAAKAAPAARDAFAALRKAAYAFADARSGAEVDMSGTARAQMSIEAEEETRDQFVRRLDDFLNGRVPAATAARARAADEALNAMWKRIAARGEQVQEFGTVTLTEVRRSQRAWLKYRDAFAAFSMALGKPSEGVVTALTVARTAQLKELLPEG